MEKATKIIELLKVKGVELSEDEIAAFYFAFSTRGKYKGYLKKQCPSYKYPLSQAIWQAIQPNAFKIGISTVMFMADEPRALYDRLSQFKYPAYLDYDMESLQTMGVW